MATYTNVIQLLNSADFTPSQQQVLRLLIDAIVDDRTTIGASLTALDTALDTLVAKMNTDFTAQNGAVGSSQLDTDYAGALSAMSTTTGLTGLPT